MTYSLELTFSPCSVLSIFYFSDTVVSFSTFSGFHKYFYTSKLQKYKKTQKITSGVVVKVLGRS